MKDTEQPWLVNGFKGTWAISEHSLIPSNFLNFLHECFPHVDRLKKVPMDDINRTLNEVWEGPGSVEKILRLTHELRQTVSNIGPIDLPKKKTIIDDDDDDTGPVSSIGNESFDFDTEEED